MGQPNETSISALVEMTIDQCVAVITLNDPATHNSFTPGLLSQLISCLDSALGNDDVSAILLRAEGRHFCAGGDLKALAADALRSQSEILEGSKPIHDLFQLLSSPGKPIIAAINGAAIGGGMGIACAAHLTIASHDARFGCPEIKLGLFPFLIMPALRNAVGDCRALEIALSASTLDAEQATSAGIVSRVVPAADLDRTALEMAHTIASYNPAAVRLGLQTFRKTHGMLIDESLRINHAVRAQCLADPNVHEGVTATLEKRSPVWVRPLQTDSS